MCESTAYVSVKPTLLVVKKATGNFRFKWNGEMFEWEISIYIFLKQKEKKSLEFLEKKKKRDYEWMRRKKKALVTYWYFIFLLLKKVWK